MLNEVGLSAFSAPPGVNFKVARELDVQPELVVPQDELAESRPERLRLTLALGFMAVGSCIPAVTMAAETPVVEMRAIARPGTSSVLDEGVSQSHQKGWRTFGHQMKARVWFDADGNWSDTHTAVSADQFAAMPPEQQKIFAARLGLRVEEIHSGNAERALLHPAVGNAQPGEVIDARVSLGTEPDGTRRFGHAPVAGQLFDEGRWRDTGTLVSADQAAAMAPSQREQLGPNLQLGDASRVLFDVDTSRDDPAMVKLAAERPNVLVTFRGFRMKPAAALAFARLEGKLEQHFPGREVRITATTGGRHQAIAHKQGGAVDFVVGEMTREESRQLEKLCWQSGFKPFNEYVHSSKFKTGNHMHVQLADR